MSAETPESPVGHSIQSPLDLFVIGGGINGAGIARDAAGRGLRVALCEKDDLAQGTSSRSGKLIHGGLRYLEYYEFRLVREALIEREVLLESAPHIIWPMRFLLPHSPADRPAWLIRLGLFLYDHLGGRKRLPGTRVVNLQSGIEGEPLHDQFIKGFEYSDCWVDDSRLVVLNALDASERGAAIMPRTAFEHAERVNNLWKITVECKHTGQRDFYARALVNAAGPWVNHVIDNIDGSSSTRSVRLVKGSHIVVKKFWQGEHAYLLQNADKRVIFVNPYEQHYALIGTTDIPHQGVPQSATVESSETDYLIKTVNRYFRKTLSADDIVYSYTGVRPLYDDDTENPSAVTRDYTFDLDSAENQAPLLSVFGGKITTFRKLAEQAMERIRPYIAHCESSWTSGQKLPGGDFPDADFEAFLQSVTAKYPWLDSRTARHLAHAFGTRIHRVIGSASNTDDLGKQFSEIFYAQEAVYLLQHEWAETADDILFRRSKHGLHMSDLQRRNFERWLSGYLATEQHAHPG
ncbi:glycerol-3-phosphate dehydrogenase [Chromatiales bacterium (ex Bugula neritina AB1)]|nr:glycerol-3-phosphate dehydrogenase [Chromatiales bacterium (ex Bugula neritina AB1)]